MTRPSTRNWTSSTTHQLPTRTNPAATPARRKRRRPWWRPREPGSPPRRRPLPECRALPRAGRSGIGTAPGAATTERRQAMHTATPRKLTDEERAERRQADREYARHAVEQLRNSEGWQRWLGTRRHFHSYSLSNQLLIAMTRPTATRVAGFRKWLDLGYAVQRGQHAIKIWAPCPPSRKQLERWQQAGAPADQRPRTYFKLVPVFDRLSRVRSGGCRRRPSREIRCMPVSRLCCSSAPASRRRGRLWPARSSRSRRPRATTQRRSRARLAGTPGNRSALTRCRECRHPVPIPAISRTDGKSPKAAACTNSDHVDGSTGVTALGREQQRGVGSTDCCSAEPGREGAAMAAC